MPKSTIFDKFEIFSIFGEGFASSVSRILALILYQDTLKNFVYNRDASGNAILVNKGNSRSTNNGLLYTGRGLELGADNDLGLPIAHTLLGELFNNSIYSNSADSTETPLADGVNIVGDGSGADSLSGNFHFSTTTNETNKTMVIEFYATIISGSLTFLKIYNGTEVIDIPDYTIVNGYNKIEVPSGSSFNSIQLYYNGSISYNIDFAYSTCSVKEVTNPDSFLTIVHGDGSVEQVGNSVDGGSSEEYISDTLTYGTAVVTEITPEIDNVVYTASSASTRMDRELTEVLPDNTPVLVSFYLSINSGEMTLRRYYTGSAWENLPNGDHVFVDGLNQFLAYTRAGASSVTLETQAGWTEIDFDISGNSVKVILPTSTHYIFNNQTILEVMPITAPFTTEDLALMQADTTLLARLALGEDNAGGLSLVTADVYGWYSFTENEGAYVVDARAGYGSEEVTNGTFDTDLAGWNSSNTDVNNTITWNSGAVDIVADGLTALNFSQTGVFTQGNIYYIAIEASNRTGTDFRVQNTSTADIGFLSKDGINGFLFKCTTATIDLFVFRAGASTVTIDNVSVREATAEEISNYTAVIRENVDQNPKGLQTTCLELDGAGVPTAVDFTKLHWYGVGYGDTQFNPSPYSEFIIEENVGVVFYSHIYDGVNLTTWTDGVEGTPTAHSPENAAYLLGKGVYPKVAADPYTTYTQDWFKTIDNATQIADYDALQAYNDWAGI